jgi:deoxyribodipyrimidine photo-lyase
MRILMLFTRDLRVRDHPALAAACADGAEVLPLFVADPVLWSRSPNRAAFLHEALADLDHSLSRRGARLIVRTGDVAETAGREATRRRCDVVYLTRDVTITARRRVDAIRALLDDARVREFPGNEVVDPGTVTPASEPAYRVFTPYLRAWERAPRRPMVRAPDAMCSMPYIRPGRLPTRSAAIATLPPGGETAGRSLLRRYLGDGVNAYEGRRNDLAADATSHLSAYIRFGCLSPIEIERRSAAHADAGGFRRQLAWRDFFRQLVAADPTRTWRDLRPSRASAWRHDPVSFEAWRSGQTGEPLVDAAMRQLEEEGWMPNRARLIAASYLTRTLGLDWRLGAAHFDRHLVDGDPCSNTANWQWVAGTGANPRRGAALSMARQTARFDPTGRYRAAHLAPEGPPRRGHVG